ncbi:hypothetical protein OQA88_6664 [Cercophora sp. LCS_1]
MANFRLSFLLTALAAVAVQATAEGDNLALLQRQAPGTPKYECHSNCGNALAGGRLAGHCDNSTWTGLYEACLDCALEFDIWQHYSNGLTTAASACGLTPTPDPADDVEETGSASGSAAPTPSGASGSAAAPSTTAPPTTTPPAAATTAATAGAAGLQAMGLGVLVVAGLGAIAAL